MCASIRRPQNCCILTDCDSVNRVRKRDRVKRISLRKRPLPDPVPVGAPAGAFNWADFAVSEPKPCLNRLVSPRRVCPSTVMATSATTRLPMKNTIRSEARRLRNPPSPISLRLTLPRVRRLWRAGAERAVDLFLSTTISVKSH
jgi:hypothetical protein